MAVSYKVGSFESPVNSGDTLTLTIGFETKYLMLWCQTAQSYESFAAEALFNDGYGYQEGPLTPMQDSFFATRWVALFNKQSSLGLTSGSVIFIGGALNWSAQVVQNCRIDVGGISPTDLRLVFGSTPTTQPPFKYEYLAIGGDVERANGAFSAPTTTGQYTIAHGMSPKPTFAQFNFAGRTMYGGITIQGYGFSRGYTNGTRQGVTSMMSKGDSSGAAGANPGVIHCAQRTDAVISIQHGYTGAIIAQASLVEINDANIVLDFTIASVYPVPNLNITWVALNGVTCDVGSFVQPASASSQDVVTAIAEPQVLLAQSYGFAASDLIEDHLRYSFGITDGSSQHALWMGANDAAASAAVLRSVRTQTALSTVYSAHPTSTTDGSSDAHGTVALTSPGFTVTWAQADATRRQWIYVAFGDEVVPPVPPTPGGTPGDVAPTLIKRFRRAPVIVDENFFIKHKSFELIADVGIGLTDGQGSDPTVILEWSDDGGRTWSNQHRLSAGAIGEWTTRLRWARLGLSRYRVYQITVADPVPWVFSGAFLVLERMRT